MKKTRRSRKPTSAAANTHVHTTGGRLVAPADVLHAVTTNIDVRPSPYDPVAADAALEQLMPRLRAILPDHVAIPKTDVGSAALGALGVHALLTQVPALKARMEKLHDVGEFDMTTLSDLHSSAITVLCAVSRARAAGAFETDAKVPLRLVAEATEVEGRMQELLEYKFRRDPKIAPLLALLRPGTGHRDTAEDLMGYADLYEQEHAVVSKDTTNYRPTDLADARRLAGEILSYLAASMSPKAREAYDLLCRAWTLLLQVYFEVREVAACLLRYDPRRDEKLPSLHSAGRAGRPRKKASGQDEASPLSDTLPIPTPVVPAPSPSPATPSSPGDAPKPVK